MATGTIKTMREDKGFGFIKREGAGAGGDLFFHRTAVVNDAYDQLREGDQVSFDEEPDPRDPTRRRAVNVQAAGDGEADDV